MSPGETSKALSDLQGHFELKRLELRAPRLELDNWRLTRAVHALPGVVIYMSLLTHLSLPESVMTEFLLLHISLLPRLQSLIIFPARITNNLFGKASDGFVSLRSLDVPNTKLLRPFLSYPLRGLEALKVGNLDRDSLPILSRKLTGLRQLHIESESFSLQEIFILGGCFQLEEIEVITQYPLEMGDLDRHRFRDMFRNLRFLSIVTRERCSRIGVSLRDSEG